MRKIIESVVNWFHRLSERRRASRERRMLGFLAAESIRRIQVMEFGGELYMSFDGAPLVSEHALRDGKTLSDYVQDCRETWVLWQRDRYEGEIVLHVDRAGGVTA